MIPGGGPYEVGPVSVDNRRSKSDNAAALQRVCRIGGLQFDSLLKSTRYLAKDFAPEIRGVSGVDLHNGLDGVHPPEIAVYAALFCLAYLPQNHRSVITRAQSAVADRFKFGRPTDGCTFLPTSADDAASLYC